MKPILAPAKSVGAREARLCLPKLLARVANGEHFVITRYGNPVARLVPLEAGSVESVRAAISAVAAIRRQLGRDGVTLAGILEPGETARNLAHADHRS